MQCSRCCLTERSNAHSCVLDTNTNSHKLHSTKKPHDALPVQHKPSGSAVCWPRDFLLTKSLLPWLPLRHLCTMHKGKEAGECYWRLSLAGYGDVSVSLSVIYEKLHLLSPLPSPRPSSSWWRRRLVFIMERTLLPLLLLDL